VTQTCAEFAGAVFWIERLVEALPAPEMARCYPEEDAELRIEPAFIAFRLVYPRPKIHDRRPRSYRPITDEASPDARRGFTAPRPPQPTQLITRTRP
jgi:hypothetical protein